MPAQVLAYSHKALCELFAEKSENTRQVVEQKLHAEYFRAYFDELKARTIVVESDYVDHDFLEDFAAYYVRCFASYQRFCTRLHFFSVDFDQNQFADIFHEKLEFQRQLQQSYLGFIVVRPIPERIIGRTCLATYSSTSERRFPTARPCEVSLFGLSLKLSTIAFQEQDRAVSACATSALWSVFQGTGFRFHHRIPSPAEITRRATATHPLDGRAFPAGDGLMFVQIADAVRSCELEPLWLSYTEPFFLRAAIHAYMSAGIPLLLNGDIVDPGILWATAPPSASENSADCSHHGQCNAEAEKGAIPVGVHAVAIVGYRVSSEPCASEDDGFTLFSSRINTLYCHDDGVGPFARMKFLSLTTDGRTVLSTSQAKSITGIGQWQFIPDAILVPLYHKIRVPFIRIYQEVRAFDNYLAELARQLDKASSPLEESGTELPPLEWDIRLTTVNEYKSELLNRPGVLERQKVLETNLPKYLWLARGVHRDETGLDLLFDATGLELGNLCLNVVEFGTKVIQLLKRLQAKTALSYDGCSGILRTLSRSD